MRPPGPWRPARRRQWNDGNRNERGPLQSGAMKGLRGLILGVANNRSIAWGIAKAARAAGAEIALTYQGEALEKRVRPLAAELGAHVLGHCDVTDGATIDAVFAEAEKLWGGVDFVVHCIAFSDKDQLTGRYIDTTEDNFIKSLAISCYSFTAIAQRAEKLMKNGGSMLTLTYYGAEKWMPHYNVMGVAKAALEASVRYLAADLGQQEHPRQRHLGRPDQDARRLGHRRFPLHPALERIQRAAEAHRHHRRGRPERGLSAVADVARRHRRNPARRRGLPHRRHEAPRRARRQCRGELRAAGAPWPRSSQTDDSRPARRARAPVSQNSAAGP